MVVNMGKSEGTLHMRSWVWEAPHFTSPTHIHWVPITHRALPAGYGAVHPLVRHGVMAERARSLVLIPAQSFLGYRILDQPVSGKRCEKKSLSQVEEVDLESFRQENGKARPRS